MPNANYEKGRDWEWQLIEKWEADGALSVTRGAGSHGMDVVAIFPNNIYVAECKTTQDWPPPPYEQERHAIVELIRDLRHGVKDNATFFFAIRVEGRPHRHIILYFNTYLFRWRIHSTKLRKGDWEDDAFKKWVELIERSPNDTGQPKLAETGPVPPS